MAKPKSTIRLVDKIKEAAANTTSHSFTSHLDQDTYEQLVEAVKAFFAGDFGPGYSKAQFIRDIDGAQLCDAPFTKSVLYNLKLRIDRGKLR